MLIVLLTNLKVGVFFFNIDVDNYGIMSYKLYPRGSMVLEYLPTLTPSM